MGQRGVLETFQSFRYEPSTGAWHFTQDPGLTVDLERRGNGTGFFTSGAFIYREEDSSVVGRFSRQLGSQLTIGTQGSTFLTNTVRQRELQRFANPNAVYSMAVSATLPGPGGESVLREGYVSLSPRGGAVYTREAQPQSKEAFQKYRMTLENKTSPPDTIGEYRLATPAELVERGLIGWLVKNARDELNRPLTPEQQQALGLTDQASLYEIARAIAANITVAPAVTYFVPAFGVV
jgi:hypothetical protein